MDGLLAAAASCSLMIVVLAVSPSGVVAPIAA